MDVDDILPGGIENLKPSQAPSSSRSTVTLTSEQQGLSQGSDQSSVAFITSQKNSASNLRFTKDPGTRSGTRQTFQSQGSSAAVVGPHTLEVRTQLGIFASQMSSTASSVSASSASIASAQSLGATGSSTSTQGNARHQAAINKQGGKMHEAVRLSQSRGSKWLRDIVPSRKDEPAQKKARHDSPLEEPEQKEQPKAQSGPSHVSHRDSDSAEIEEENQSDMDEEETQLTLSQHQQAERSRIQNNGCSEDVEMSQTEQPDPDHNPRDLARDSTQEDEQEVPDRQRRRGCVDNNGGKDHSSLDDQARDYGDEEDDDQHDPAESTPSPQGHIPVQDADAAHQGILQQACELITVQARFEGAHVHVQQAQLLCNFQHETGKAVGKWQDCSLEEWQQGGQELVQRFSEVMNRCVKLLADKSKCTEELKKRISDHKAKLEGQGGKLNDMKGSLEKYLRAIGVSGSAQ